MTGFGTLCALECEALWSRRLARVGVGLTLGVAAAGAARTLVRDPSSEMIVRNGFRCLAQGFGPGLSVAACVALLLGSQSVAAEAAEGSLRATLFRPVSRGAVLGAKAVALGLVALVLAAAVALGAATVGALGPGYGDVVLEYAGGLYPKQAAGTMAGRGALLCALAPLGIAAAAGLGLLVSVATDHAGAAATTALLIAIPLGLGSTLKHPSTALLFPRPGLEVWTAFASLADGNDTAGWAKAPLAAAALVPAATAALALAVAAWWFRRRDVLC